MRRFAVSSIAVLLIAPSAVAARPAGAGQPASSAPRRASDALLDRSDWSPARRKLDTALADVVSAAEAGPTGHAAIRRNGAPVASTAGRVSIDITADVDRDLLTRIASLGGSVVSSYPQYDAVRADVPVASLEALAADARIRAVVPAEEPMVGGVRRGTTTLDAGAIRAATTVVTSEGVATHGVPAVRTQYNAMGQGVRVGVLSDGIDGPASPEVPAVTVIPGAGGSGREGRAMIEIIHDLAPGADVYFATALGGRATMAANILALADAGCTVIVDDVGYLSEPPFQDGLIAKAVSFVTAAGVTYVAAAGNGGRLTSGRVSTAEAEFVASGEVVPAGEYHDFDPGAAVDTTASITVAPGDVVTLAWNDADGASANDYDVEAVDGGANVVAAGVNVQDGNDLAFELLTVPPAGAVAVKVRARPGAQPRVFHLAVVDGFMTEWATAGGAYGHSASADTISVGATAAAAAVPPGVAGPFPGVFTAANQPEVFSADGPRRMYYDAAGNQLTPGDLSASGGAALQKPDLLAADGVSTSTPSYDPFYGTSAAAPHAAAIAALVRSARPGATAAQVRAALLAGVLDVAPVGWDRDAGLGILMAPLAVAAVGPELPDDFVSFAPRRILETRAGVGQVGYQGGKPAAGQTIVLQVTGLSAPSTPADASAVALNITGTDAVASGFVTVWPCDAPRPLASNLNLAPGDTRANLVISKLSASGTVCLFSLQSVDLLADVAGYLPARSRFTPLVPERLLETRAPDPVGYAGPTPVAGQVVRLQVVGAGASQVPGTASAVVLNVTAVDSVAAGFVTVWPCDAPLPTASNINLAPGVITPNMVISKLSADGAVCIYTQVGGNVLADIAGYFIAGPNGYVAVNPSRLLDTRTGVGAPDDRSAGRVVELTVTGGAAGVPADATAVTLNVTGTDVTSPGFVTVWPCGQERPTASNLNLVTRQTRPNLVLAAVGANGKVCLFTQQPASLVADLMGYFP